MQPLLSFTNLCSKARHRQLQTDTQDASLFQHHGDNKRSANSQADNQRGDGQRGSGGCGAGGRLLR